MERRIQFSYHKRILIDFKEMDDFYNEYMKKNNSKFERFITSKIDTNIAQIIQTIKGNGNTVVGVKMTQIGKDGCKQTQSVEFKNDEKPKEKKRIIFRCNPQGFINIAKIFEKLPNIY